MPMTGEYSSSCSVNFDKLKILYLDDMEMIQGFTLAKAADPNRERTIGALLLGYQSPIQIICVYGIAKHTHI